MDGAQKLKVALDETQMLILGAQVLLGFQFQGPFQDAFAGLSASAKGCHALALLLTVAVVGLLIAPAIHHRVVDNGHVTARMLRGTGIAMGVALVPFSASLGLNIFIVMQRLAGTAPAAVCGIVAGCLALWFWFGIEAWASGIKGDQQ
jgi:hypothetical protein